jgi:hypothetical protein
MKRAWPSFTPRSTIASPPSSPRRRPSSSLAVHFPAHRDARSIIVPDVDRIQDPCGYGVPRYTYQAAWRPTDEKSGCP